MTGAELLEHARNTVLRDAAQPYLWSDDVIYLYLNEAQKLFARRTYALLDNTSDFTSLTLEIGTAEYTLDPSIVYVYSAHLDGQSADLRNYTRHFLPSNLITTTGMPSCFSMDEAANIVRVYPVPDAVFTLKLRVARLPLTAISDSTSPEIPEQYHLDLVEYAAYRCLSDNDPEGTNLGAADGYKKTWGERLSTAKNEYYRIRAGNNPTAMGNWTGKR